MIFMHFAHVFQLEFLCIQLCLVANSFRWYLNMYVSQQNVSSTKRFLLQNVTHKTFPPQNIVSTKRFLLQNITYKTFPPQNVYWYKILLLQNVSSTKWFLQHNVSRNSGNSRTVVQFRATEFRLETLIFSYLCFVTGHSLWKYNCGETFCNCSDIFIPRPPLNIRLFDF